jgi:hypothetical protein
MVMMWDEDGGGGKRVCDARLLWIRARLLSGNELDWGERQRASYRAE